MTYKDKILHICNEIHSGLIDFDTPRDHARKPTQASTEFITKKQQGDWAENVIFNAINNNATHLVAVKYGKSDDLVAGEDGFDELYEGYQQELDTIGKRPDILLFQKKDFNSSLGYDISMHPEALIREYVTHAVAAIEVRSSSFLIDKYMEETNRVTQKCIKRVLELKYDVLTHYDDLLKKKRPELIAILEQLDETSVRTIDFRAVSWRSTSRLQELSSKLSEMKALLKELQKRNSLSITPKVEDLKVVQKWIMTYNVPHFYVQVFFDKVFGISFKKILELLANPDCEDEEYFVERDNRNQNKTTIKIPTANSACIAQRVDEPVHRSKRKEMPKGRLLYYVTFEGGAAYFDTMQFKNLFGVTM